MLPWIPDPRLALILDSECPTLFKISHYLEEGREKSVALLLLEGEKSVPAVDVKTFSRRVVICNTNDLSRPPFRRRRNEQAFSERLSMKESRAIL